ncbi:MAG: hypothetical protein M3301_00720 [Chloroflexota bacterium]|nr:hypothetical protein [Chloroflexota bacterium]
MSAERRTGALLLVAGLVAMAAVHRVAPVASPPLFDGLVVEDPYRYLSPPRGGLTNPSSASRTERVAGGGSPPIFVATSETPPQAQLNASPDAFTMPRGTTAVTARIRPVPSPLPPRSGHIASNVYRFEVANQAGTPLVPRRDPTLFVSIILRTPHGIEDAVVARYANGAWQRLTTEPAGQPAIFLANTTSLGDFAVLASGPAPVVAPDSLLAATPTPGLTPSPTPAAPATSQLLQLVVFALVLVVVAAVIVGGLLVLERRSRYRHAAAGSRGNARADRGRRRRRRG